MPEAPLAARFDALLKRYQDQLSRLPIDLSLEPQAPTAGPDQPAPTAPAPTPSPAWAARTMPLTPPPRNRPLRPKPVWRLGRWSWLAGLSLAAGAAAAWWGYLRLQEKPAYQAFPVPGTAWRGLVWQDGTLAASDTASGGLVVLDHEARRLKSEEKLAAVTLDDLAWTNGSFWSTAHGRQAVFRHEAKPEHGVERVYTTPDRFPEALAADGDDLWAADAKSPVVYRYLIGRALTGASLSPLNRYDLPGAPAASLHAAESRLWVLDSRGRRLTRYGYDGGTLAPIDAVELGGRIPPKAQVSGLTVGGGFLWVLTAKPAVLHRFSLRDLVWRPARP